MKKLYCYCIFKPKDDSDKIKMKGKVFIKHKDLYMLCEEVTDVKTTKKGILEHDKIVREVFDQTDTIPISYGTVVKSKKDAETFLMKNFATIEKIFQRIENKIEVNVKLIWNKESFQKDVETKEIAKMKKTLEEKEKVTDQDKIELGKLVENRVLELREQYKNEIVGALEKYAEDVVNDENMTPRMALKVAFLVDKSKEDEFDQGVNEFYNKYKDVFNFKYIGPLPPYSFINEKLK